MLCAKSLIKGLCLALWTCAVAQAQVAQDWVSIKQGTSGAMAALDAGNNNAYVAGSVPASTMLLTKFSPTGCSFGSARLTTRARASKAPGLLTRRATSSLPAPWSAPALIHRAWWC